MSAEKLAVLNNLEEVRRKSEFDDTINYEMIEEAYEAEKAYKPLKKAIELVTLSLIKSGLLMLTLKAI